MTLITFTSDFGLSDHYVALTKARILKEDPKAQIVDISHAVKPFDLPHMAYVLQSVFREFPSGTVHLIGSNNNVKSEPDYLIALIEGHFFVGPNNGIISLLSEQQPTAVYSVDTSEEANGLLYLSQVVVKLARGNSPDQFGTPLNDYTQYMPRKARATKSEIAGHVIHVDHYGNLITNIEKTDFDILSAKKSYRITFGRDHVRQVNTQMKDVDPGEVFFLFTSNGQLMLGINQGNAAQLLGLEYDSPIVVQFEN